ncbi:zinc finger protein [Macleaya cordata]|uniref:Zinc finger protein n=1 Tax=Macleaya cordata TaxID=56857 RepID=A0A200RAG8_MACCD|nr:zinc finger protein [Macleaya cordata]
MASSEASNTNEVCGTLPILSNVDIAWEWGELKDPNNKKHVTCRLCAKSMHGGINRLKEHLLQIRGNVTSCPKATIEIMKKLRESMSSKKLKRAMKDKIDSFFEKGDDDDNDDGGGDNVGEEDDDVVEVDHKKDGDPPKASGSKSDATSKKKVGGGASKKLKAASNVRGPLDAMLKTDVDKTKQATLDKNNPIKEKLKLEAWRAIVEWITEAGIAFNAIRCPSFPNMIHKIGEYGRAMPPPSYHQASKYKEIKYGIYSAIDKLFLDPIEHDQAMLDLKYYGDAMGMFGSPSAKRHRDKLQPFEEEARDFVREGDDLTWTQVREALGATEAGPSTRKRKQTSTDSIPRFSLLDESDEDDGFDIEVEEGNVGKRNDGNDGRGKKKMTDGNVEDDYPNMLS